MQAGDQRFPLLNRRPWPAIPWDVGELAYHGRDEVHSLDLCEVVDTPLRVATDARQRGFPRSARAAAITGADALLPVAPGSGHLDRAVVGVEEDEILLECHRGSLCSR